MRFNFAAGFVVLYSIVILRALKPMRRSSVNKSGPERLLNRGSTGSPDLPSENETMTSFFAPHHITINMRFWFVAVREKSTTPGGGGSYVTFHSSGGEAST